MPTSLAEAPRTYPWLVLYERAFWDLIGDRCAPKECITWMARQTWADRHGLDDVQTELLHTHVKAMDLAFLGYLRDKEPSGQTGDGDRGRPQ